MRPELVDCFRLNFGNIYNDVDTARTFDEALWERMRKGESFAFDEQLGFYPDCDSGSTPYQFPMNEYLMSREPGFSLSEILGLDVRLVTQRNVIKQLMYKLMNYNLDSSMTFHLERFGNIIFAKEATGQQAPITGAYSDMRFQFFSGEDRLGCVGSTPINKFAFPDVGKAYNIFSLDHGGERVVYSCAVRNYDPYGDAVESTIVRSFDKVPPKRKQMMALKAVTGPAPYHMYMKYQNKKLKMEFVDADAYLSGHPEFQSCLEQALDLLLDPKIFNFLAMRRACVATLQREPTVHLQPQNVPPGYQSFLPKEFFMRFFDD